MVDTCKTVTLNKKGEETFGFSPLLLFMLEWFHSFIIAEGDSLAICPHESQSDILPSGYVNWGFADKRVIFVLKVCFIYKTFLEKSQAGTPGIEPGTQF